MLKILLVLLVIALVIYGVTRAIERRGISPTPRRQAPPRQIAPDDDPDFLWDIERRRRHEAKDQDKKEPGSPAPGSPAPRAQDPSAQDPLAQDPSAQDPLAQESGAPEPEAQEPGVDDSDSSGTT